MDRMTKREMKDYIKQQQYKMWETTSSKEWCETHDTAADGFNYRRKVYHDCKKIAADNGYADGCFEQLWNKATDERASELNVIPRNPKARRF